MKFITRLAFCMAWLAMASGAMAQIPVTDSSAIATQVANQLETIAKWKVQYDQMTRQISSLEQQVTAMTGSRGLGTTSNDSALREYLPADWQKVYDGVRGGGYAGLSSRAEAIRQGSQVYDSCARLATETEKTLCQARSAKAAQDKAFALDAYDKSRARLAQIDRLMQQINATDDPKSVAEMQARIGAEQAMIQNEQTRLQLFQMIAQAEDRLQQQREREAQSKVWASRKGITPAPLTFGAKD